MEISKPFIRLPFAFDADKLAEEVRNLPNEAWTTHPTGFRGNSSVPLISRDGGDNDEFHGRMRITKYLQCCRYMQQVMASFGEVLGRSRLMKLAPDCKVSEHIDFNYHWYTRVRIHVPIITNPKVTFFCAQVSVHMRSGESWIFDSWSPHRVVNAGEQDRVHLVIDTAGSSRFWQTVRCMHHFDPLSDAASIDAVVETIPFDPLKQIRVLTENFNIVPVMSPGELDALIRDLIRDFTDNPNNDRRLVTDYCNLLMDFASDWRELWHLYGYCKEGWSRYKVAVSEVYRQLHPDMCALVTQSNGVGVNLIIVHRILKPALATDQYERFVSAQQPAALAEQGDYDRGQASTPPAIPVK